MRALRAITAALALALLSQAAGCALTGRQVVARAGKFLRDIGREIPAGQPQVSRTAQGWRAGAWKGEFGSVLHVDVSDSTGRIVGFWDQDAVPRGPAHTPVPEQQAVEFATNYLQAAGGLPEGAALQSVNPLAPFDEGRPAGWQVIWIRRQGSLRYLHDSLNVQVDAASGRLVGYANNFVSAPPESLEARVSRGDAEGKAVVAFRGGKPGAAELVLVDPDFLGGHSDHPQRSVLAWQVRFEGGGDVILDARDGSLVSIAALAGSLPSMGKQDMDIRLCLAKATRVQIVDQKFRFVVSEIDLRKNPGRRASLVQCMEKTSLPDQTAWSFWLVLRAWLPGLAHQDFWVRPDRRKPALHQPREGGRARFWPACERFFDLLEIPWFDHTGKAPAGRCTDVRPLFQAADSAVVERVLYSLASNPPSPQRAERTVSLGRKGLGDRLASLVDPKPLLLYGREYMRFNGHWRIILRRAGKPIAEVFWRDGNKRGLLHYGPWSDTKPVCAWETAGKEFREILESALSAGKTSRKGGK